MTTPASDPVDTLERRVAFLLGEELGARWSADQRLGWAGIMEITRLLPPRHNREMLDRHGLSLTLLSLLGRIEESSSEVLQARDLAIDVDLSPGKVSRHLTTLEAEGLLTRSHTADDGRGLDVKLTAAGRERLAEARQTAVEIVERDFISLLTPEEATVLARVAAKVMQAAGRREGDGRSAEGTAKAADDRR